MLDTLIVIAIFVLFYFILVRPLQKRYGHGTYRGTGAAANENDRNWWTDPSNPRSEVNTKYKEW